MDFEEFLQAECDRNEHSFNNNLFIFSIELRNGLEIQANSS